MIIILSVCVLLSILGIGLIFKREQLAQQQIQHLSAKTVHLEQHLSQTLALIQDITQKMQQQQQAETQQLLRVQQLEQQQAQLVALMTQLVKAQHK